VHPTIQAAVAAQHVKDMLAQAAEDGRAREARQARGGRHAREAGQARPPRHPRLASLIPQPRLPSDS
jgi:hypothetical protein